MKKTLYQILGIDPKASAEDIAAAYARLSAKTDWADSYMPGLVREANEILSDSQRRRAYDASLAGRRVQAAVGPDWDDEPAFLARWGKWIVAVVVLIGVAAWWSARRESPPAPASRPPAVAREATPQPAAPREEQGAAAADAKPSEASEPTSATPVAAPVASPATTPVVAARSAENVFADVAPSVARVNVLDAAGRTIATGSGVVIGAGAMLTNCHVAMLGTRLSVKLGGTVMPATVELADEALDLCRLRVPDMHAPAVAIGSVTTLRTGQQVYAIGAPAGLELTISEGIVSSLRKVDEGTVIQTTAPISSGSSGGGLFDVSGRLVGITTFQHRFGQNLNFALPADWIAQMRARRVTDAGWRVSSISGRSADATPSAMIVGRWLCRDWTTGRTAEYNFEVDGRLGIALDDNRAATLSYGVSGRTLHLADAKGAVTLAIEELTDRKLILHGRDRSVACERQ